MSDELSHLTIRELKSSEYMLWDNLVMSSLLGTVFHESFWLNICRDSLNDNLHLYGCFNDNNDLVAGCPLFEKKRFALKYGSAILKNSMVPYGGFLYKTEESDNVRKKEQRLRENIQAFHDYLKIQQFDLVTMILPPGLIDIRPFIQNKWKEKIHYTYTINPKIKNYQKGMRGNIKKAIQQGIKIEKYEHNDGVTRFYSLLQDTYQRHGLSVPCPEKYIRNIYDYLKEKGRAELWIALTKEGEWSAAEMFLSDHNCPHRWTAATSTKYIKTESSSLLLETIFDKYAMENKEYVNLMAGNISELSSFISGFNPDLSVYMHIEYMSKIFEMWNHIKSGILIGKR
jgi:hypothetical protein